MPVSTNIGDLYAGDFLRFAADLHVPLGARTGRLGDHWAPFQKRDFAAIAPSLQALAIGKRPRIRKYWRERTKGASKDQDAAVVILYLLAFATRSLRIQVGAYDVDQASEVKLIIRQILSIDHPLNRKLASVIDVQQRVIISHRSTAHAESMAELLTTDHLGTHGSRPDVTLINELSHIANEEFAQTLADNADKCPHGVRLICTNAGHNDTWQQRWRTAAENSPEWDFATVSQPAPWVTDGDLRESRLRNPLSRYQRLWEGKWVDAVDNPALSEEDIYSCITEPDPMEGAVHGMTFIGGIDLAVKNDRCALVVVGCDFATGIVRLAYCKSWQPVPGEEVNLEDVESHILQTHQRFHCLRMWYDVHQAALMAQRLKRFGVPMTEQVFAGRQLDIMANTLIATFAARQIALYGEPELIEDLKALQVEDRPWGLKLVAPRDRSGHADLGITLAMILPHANKRALQQWLVPHVTTEETDIPPPKFGERTRRAMRGVLAFPQTDYSSALLVQFDRRGRVR